MKNTTTDALQMMIRNKERELRSWELFLENLEETKARIIGEHNAAKRELRELNREIVAKHKKGLNALLEDAE
tara:strand:- start:150 stop:365 length:216 start_codon:yes stop_codon:yes gene_type:complete